MYLNRCKCLNLRVSGGAEHHSTSSLLSRTSTAAYCLTAHNNVLAAMQISLIRNEDGIHGAKDENRRSDTRRRYGTVHEFSLVAAPDGSRCFEEEHGQDR